MSAPLARFAKTARYLAALALIISSISTNAQDWGATATISSTMGVNDGRVCTGESSRGDIGCAANAPYVNRATGLVGIFTNNPAEYLHVGNATNGGRMFVGEDGSARRGLLIAAATNLELASSTTPYVRLHAYDYSTLGGVNIHINPFAGGLVRIGGINGGISANAAPSSTLHIMGALRIAAEASTTLNTCDANRTGAIKFQSGDFYVCRNGSSWETLASIAGGGFPDRIVSGTAYVQTNSNNTVSISGTTYIGNGTNTSAALKIGSGATGNRFAYIDLTGDSTYTDYGLRLMRENTGANARSWLQHRGTGELYLMTQEEAPIVFQTNATERMRIIPNGNVGIGIATPSATFHVNGTNEIARFGTNNLINQYLTVRNVTAGATLGLSPAFSTGGDAILQGGTNKGIAFVVNQPEFASGTTAAMRIDGLGGVGIGTNTPTTALQVSGTVTATRFVGDGSLLTGISAGGTPDRIVSGTAYVQTNSNNTVSISGTTYIGYGTNQATGLEIGTGSTGNRATYLNFGGDTTYPSYSFRIARAGTGANAATNVTHRGTGLLQFTTVEAAPIAFFTSGTESMRILPNGNVGIGQTAPGYALDVSGTSRISNGYLIVSQTGTGVALGANNLIGTLEAFNSATPSTKKPLILQRWGGYVGIGGTDSPTEALEVLGNVKATRFIGDGSLLTGIASGATDRIVSGTNAVIANTAGNSVSFTLAGTAGRAYVHTTAGFVGPAVSTTVSNVQGMRMLASTAGEAAATPGFAWVGDDNTGMFRAGADTLGFTTAGTESMRILPNGAVGIGTSIPNAPLDISASSQTKLRLSDSSGAYTNITTTDGAGAGIDPIMDLNLMGDSDTNHVVRFFRTTNTTGQASVQFLRGDNTVSPGAQINTNGTAPTYFAAYGGNVGIGKSNPGTNLDVSGSIQYTGILTDVSDRRAKTTIEALPFASVTQKLSQLAAVQFEMKETPGVKEYGFIAQDVEKVFPRLVTTMNDASQTKALNYMGLIPLLVKSNQELAAENAQLKATQADILKRLEALEKRK